MDTNPYRELATVSPLVVNPIKAEFDRINSLFEKRIQDKITRILQYMTVQYLNEKPRNSGWYILYDPGANWWNFKRTIPRSEFNGIFSETLVEKCKELNIQVDDAMNPAWYSGEFILFWRFTTKG